MTRKQFSLTALAVIFTSCGYRVGGKGDTIPKSIQTIAVPPFTSNLPQYQLPDMLANQIGREFSSRTRFTVVKDPSVADAVLDGVITSIATVPTVSDPNSGRATSVQVVAAFNIKLTQRATGRVLFSRPGFVVRAYYEIASDPHQYFDETGPAYTRLSQSVAQDVVSAVMENF